jgi:hypothetical protein
MRQIIEGMGPVRQSASLDRSIGHCRRGDERSADKPVSNA